MVLIKNVQVVDGSGKPPFRSEVLLQDDRISAIGNFPTKQAEVVVDGLGSYLFPGFIDINTDSDHYLSLFTFPSQKDFLAQGVTTIVGGQCGSSLAPLLYGTLESIRKWTDVNQINVDWHTMAEFFKAIGRLRLGVNFGTLVGHSTIRRALVGEELRDLTAPEMVVFSKILKEALDQGALGLSTGLSYAHSRQTPYGELKELASIVAKNNAVYTTHLRDEERGLVAAVNETMRLSRETGVRTVISHLRPHKGFENDFQTALDAVNSAPETVRLYFDTYPFDVSIVPVYTLLPVWAQNGGLEVMRQNIETPETRERILKELPVFQPGDLTVAQAFNAPYLVGKPLGMIAENRGLKNLNEALLELMRITDLRSLVFYKNLDLDRVTKSLASTRSLVASNAASLPAQTAFVQHERFINTFPKFLAIAQQEKWPLESVIKKITSQPAEIFNIKNRGLIKEGYFADLVLWKNNKVQATFVNGQLAYDEGKFLDIYAGQIVKSH